MSIVVLGDVHGISWMYPVVSCFDDGPKLIIQLGDFGLTSEDLEKIKEDESLSSETPPIWMIDGNYEDFDFLKQFNSKAVELGLNIEYIPRGTIRQLPDGRTALFIGGAESVEKKKRPETYKYNKSETIQETDIQHLLDLNDTVDIVFSHTCPRCIKNEIIPHISNWPKIPEDPSELLLDKIMEKFKPQLWYFGHFHVSKSGIYKNTKWHCLNMVGTPIFKQIIP